MANDHKPATSQLFRSNIKITRYIIQYLARRETSGMGVYYYMLLYIINPVINNIQVFHSNRREIRADRSSHRANIRAEAAPRKNKSVLTRRHAFRVLGHPACRTSPSMTNVQDRAFLLAAVPRINYIAVVPRGRRRRALERGRREGGGSRIGRISYFMQNV